MRMQASETASNDCDSQQNERLSPTSAASLGRSGAGRVAKFVRSTTCSLKARLDRTPSHGQETKLIGTRAEHGEKCKEDFVAITETMERQQDISPAQQFKANIQVSQSCEPVASEKLVKPLVPTLSYACETAQDSKRIIYNNEIGLEQSKRYLYKLNELLRNSHLANIVAIAPPSERKGTIIKFSHNQTLSRPHQTFDQINPIHFNQKPGSLRKTITPTESLTKDRDVDAGYAWVILAVIFIINASTFGIARAYGLIFDKLARDYNKSRSDAALPFTIMGAVENMAGPLSGYLLAQWSNSWRATVFAGSCLISLAHFLTAISIDSKMGPLLSMGLLGGLGSSLVSISFFQLNNAYFVRYRSTAFGIGMTGAAFGTLYISPLCEYCLDHFGIGACYIMLGAILLPNVPLSLLLKPKIVNYSTKEHAKSIKIKITDSDICHPSAGTEEEQQKSISISELIDEGARKRPAKSLEELGVWPRIKLVVLNPVFHLIWPTQLLFCWLNFVFSMIIVDFGKDRGLSAAYLTKLVPCWAFGQLVGRLCLSSLVDFKCLSYKSFTVICLFCISITVFFVNSIRLPATSGISADPGSDPQEHHAHLILLALIFCLSTFIALLYILFNGLVVRYTEPSLQSLSIGISSFAGSFFLLPRAYIIGLYRQTSGNYDGMLTMFSVVTLAAALVWLLIPPACGYLKQLLIANRRQHRSRSKVIQNLRVYSSWKLADQQAPICRHRDSVEASTQTPNVEISANTFCYNT